MSLKYRWIIIPEDGDVVGTNEIGVAGAASENGSDLVIDLEQFTAVFDGDVSAIEKADPNDYLEDEDDGPDTELPDDEGDDE